MKTEKKFLDVFMSPRPGSLLAVKYGYRSLAKFAGALPEEARVIDVGAGRSTLGLEVCRLRPDVSWTNADLGYKKPGVYGLVINGAPSNLRFETVDVLKLVRHFKGETFDRLFSFYMLNHVVSSCNADVGRLAVENMLKVLAPGGVAAIGPTVEPELSLAAVSAKSERGVSVVTPTADPVGLRRQAAAIVEQTPLLNYAVT